MCCCIIIEVIVYYSPMAVTEDGIRVGLNSMWVTDDDIKEVSLDALNYGNGSNVYLFCLFK